MNITIPKYILKRMFPKGKCLLLVRKGDVTAPNYIMFRSINAFMPIEIAAYPEIQQLNFENLQDKIKVNIDGVNVPITLDRFKNDFEFWFDGSCYDYSFFDALTKGGTDSFLLPVGGWSSTLLKIRDNIKMLCEPGMHTIDLEVDFEPINIKVSVNLDLIDENMDIIFNPSEL